MITGYSNIPTNSNYTPPPNTSCGVFTETQIARLKALVYEEAVLLLSRDLNNLEKGVLTDIIFSWNVAANDDTLNSVDFDGIDIANNLIGTETFNVKDTVTKDLAASITRESNLVSLGVSATSTFHIPQFMGKMSTDEPVATYAGLSVYEKVIQSSTNLSFEAVLNDEHLFFLVNSNMKQVVDNDTNFAVAMGPWNSTIAEFISKTFQITLADGSLEDVTIIRTRVKKTQTLNVRLI